MTHEAAVGSYMMDAEGHLDHPLNRILHFYDSALWRMHDEWRRPWRFSSDCKMKAHADPQTAAS